MSDKSEEMQNELDLVRSFPVDDSSQEKVEELWHRLLAYKSLVQRGAPESKTRRAQAEDAHRQAEQDAVSATEVLCQSMKAEAVKELAEAKSTKKEAEALLGKAKAAKTRVESERETVLTEARAQAQEILDKVNAVAHEETDEIRRRALKEVQSILICVEETKAAIAEELETQRIFTGVARLKSASDWLQADAHSNDSAPGEADASISIPSEKADGQADGAGGRRPDAVKQRARSKKSAARALKNSA